MKKNGLETELKMNGSLWTSAGYMWSLHFVSLTIIPNNFPLTCRWQYYMPNTWANIQKPFIFHLDHNLRDFFIKKKKIHKPIYGLVEYLCSK